MSQNTIAGRLTALLQERGVTKEGFSEAMGAAGVPGSSVPAIYRYLRGDNVPSIAFIEAAARYLGVRPAWLAFGDGEASDAGEKFVRDELRMIAEGFGEGGERMVNSNYRAAALFFTWRQIAFTRQGGNLFLEEHLGTAIGEALRRPLEAFDIDPDEIPDRELTKYVVTACFTLWQLVGVLDQNPDGDVEE